MTSPYLYLKAGQFAKDHWKIILIIVLAVTMFIIMLPAIFIIVFIPSADHNLIAEYQVVADDASLIWTDLVTYDVVINDNDLSNVNPEDTAYRFLLVEYKVYDAVRDAEGNIVRWRLVENGTATGKDQILSFLQKQDYKPENIKQTIATLNYLNEVKISKKDRKYEINIIRLDLQDLISHLPADKIEWANTIISSNVLYEMFYYIPDLSDFIPVPDNSFFAWPTPDLKEITSQYGWRIHPVTKERSFHSGVDISGPSAYGRPIIAAADGLVYQVNISNGATGNNVRIKHIDSEGNEWQTRYCHMSSINVKVNEKVKKGDVIGAVGNTGLSTGPHLHFELMFNGKLIDPLPYIKALN